MNIDKEERLHMKDLSIQKMQIMLRKKKIYLNFAQHLLVTAKMELILEMLNG